MTDVPQGLVAEVQRLYVDLAPVDLQAACQSLDKLVTQHGPAIVGKAVALVAEEGPTDNPRNQRLGTF